MDSTQGVSTELLPVRGTVAADAMTVAVTARPKAKGKFIFRGDRKFYVKGVTYGAFRPDKNGAEYHDLGQVDRDFARMSANGINTVRIPHTTPPRQLLDIAQHHGLMVMVGLSAEQYAGYLADGKRTVPGLQQRIGDKVREVAGHPALLCYAIGNEIPASLARWIGRRRLEWYLSTIYRLVKRLDPDGLVTYVNYPSTEYLHLPFLDLVCFNVYLERQRTLRAYLARLQNLAGERPLLMSELGLDAFRHGEEAQAQSLDWQIRISFAAGCAGAVVFSWTDEWHRGEEDVTNWAFGLTTAKRVPKPSLGTVRNAFLEAPFPPELFTPRFSVVVCTHNGATRIGECLAATHDLNYPDYEVIVVSDGSTDQTVQTVKQFDHVRLIESDPRGLSHARNLGLKAATGEYVAYLDDDAYPDRHWLTYLNGMFQRTRHVGIGGPNVNPQGDGWIASCVSHSPGGPTHVLLTDELAEHIPGCNMAFRKSALDAVGGFDEQFRTAGDDVDICWRLQEAGGTLGFCAAAMVWHHSRNTVRAYWRQQRGYGKAEALLEAKWPEKYNSAGHHTFAGRIYGGRGTPLWASVSRIYHGVWGLAPFQLLYQSPASTVRSVPLMPEWYLLLVLLALLTPLELRWGPAPILTTLAIGGVVWSGWSAWHRAGKSPMVHGDGTVSGVLARATRAWLHLLQPLARLIGRLQSGLTVWRGRCCHGFEFPRARSWAGWVRRGTDHHRRLADIEQSLRDHRAIVLQGHSYARWDLEVRGGAFGAARLLMSAEDQGGGSQHLRARTWPRMRVAGWIANAFLGILAAGSAWAGSWPTVTVLGGAILVLILLAGRQAGGAQATLRAALQQTEFPAP